mmetsp:Transcript_58123/g.136059  ORF Transcript_58123/g.136059 Transcript_58123/m.136059 type:complete len:210 (-) Transcript_58123:583-1212(-)
MPHSRSLRISSSMRSSLSSTFCDSDCICSLKCCCDVRVSSKSHGLDTSSPSSGPGTGAAGEVELSTGPSSSSLSWMAKAFGPSLLPARESGLRGLLSLCISSRKALRSVNSFISRIFSSKISSSFCRSSLASFSSSLSCLLPRRYSASSCSKRFISSRYLRISVVESFRISDKDCSLFGSPSCGAVFDSDGTPLTESPDVSSGARSWMR